MLPNTVGLRFSDTKDLLSNDGMEAAKAVELKHAIFQCVQFKQQKINEKIAERIQPVHFEAPDKE